MGETSGLMIFEQTFQHYLTFHLMHKLKEGHINESWLNTKGLYLPKRRREKRDREPQKMGSREEGTDRYILKCKAASG